MNFFKVDQNGKVVEIVNKGQQGYQSRWDWKTFDQAQKVAEAASEFAGEEWIATDSGGSVFPRYDIIRAPKVGDLISYYFNGDCYPDGKIVKISATRKLVTSSTGRKYYRSKETGSWINHGTWCMVQGHHTSKNPHF